MAKKTFLTFLPCSWPIFMAHTLAADISVVRSPIHVRHAAMAFSLGAAPRSNRHRVTQKQRRMSIAILLVSAQH